MTFEKTISMQSNFMLIHVSCSDVFITLLLQNFLKKTQYILYQHGTVLNKQYFSTGKHTHYKFCSFSLVHLYLIMVQWFINYI